MRNLFGGAGCWRVARGGFDSFAATLEWMERTAEAPEVTESLRVLDIGPTSSTNINYITSLGHSIYMANFVEEAAKPEWIIPGEAGEEPRYDVDRFLATNLNFSGRNFDVVILWDTADYSA